MRMLNSYIKGITLFLILIFPVAAYSQEAKSDVDALKKQIEEMQRQNEEMIKNIQEQNARQIQQLQKQINELEINNTRQTRSPQQPTAVIDEETLNEKIEKSVNESILLKTKNWIKVSYSPDFPTYYRTRVRFIENGTFASATDSKDEVFFIDSRFLLSPRIDFDKYLSVRAQFDIAKNIIWGGLGDQIISDKLFESPSPGDSFRGAVLRDVVNTQFGNTVNATDEVDLVDVRSLYFYALTDYGAIWAGRQPFDWGLGLLNNAGSMPDQDLGSVVDRINFDTLPLSLIDKKWENLLFSFIFDRLSEGNSISNFDEGDGWDVGLALIYDNKDDLQLGAYVFDINQNNFALSEGITADLDNAIQWSLFGSYIYSNTRTSFEFQNIFGEINDISDSLSELLGTDSIDLSAKNISALARFEYHPPTNLIKSANLEFGWSRGDDTRTPDEIEGNTVFFNNAYVIDSLMYKHIIPTVYALEGSVINSYYFRGWSTLRLTDDLFLTPQAILGFVDQKNALALNVFEPLPAVDRYLGTELEATFTWKIREHIWFDLIGSLIFAGDGLKDLQAQRAFIEGGVESLEDVGAASHPYAITGRFVITLDGLIDKWYGSSTVLQRAWFPDDNI